MISIGSGWHSISNFGMNIKNHNCFSFFFFLLFLYVCFSFAKIYAVRNEHVIYKKCYTNYWNLCMCVRAFNRFMTPCKLG